ncbi:MAG: serine/threonine protein kinase [Chloroflexi bacterium]|nr:serine/threonine protein kinase [Chloroflexota bacterium]
MSEIKEGQVLGNRYKAIKLIGEGGFGEVWKAEDESLGRIIALKVISNEKLERSTPEQKQEFIERFKREARILAALKHIHILALFDYGDSEGLRYLVIPYHEGGTLEDRLQRVRLTLAETDRFFSQLAEALDYAHKQKIVHRDLKPSNVLVDQNDNIQLSDFGISKLLEDSVHLTQTGTAMGTPDYMSPEQFKGLPLDGRSDIYSMGVMLYEMTVGRPPFEADNKWTLAQMHITNQPPMPSSINPNLTPEIDDVILKAMAKEPEDRFNSPAEFLSAWKRAIGETEMARLVAPTDSHISVINVKSDTVSKPLGLSPKVLGVIGGGIALLLIVGTFFLLGQGAATPGAPTLVSITKSAATTLSPTNTTVPSATPLPTPTQTTPKVVGTAENNKVILRAEAFLGTTIVTSVIENQNSFNYVVQISDRNPRGAAGAAILKQPAGFQFPVNPSQDSVTIGPNQKETITLTFSTRVNLGEQIIFQSVKSDVDVLPFSLAATLKTP